MPRYSDLISNKEIPQTKPLDNNQVKNNAGGYSYPVSMWTQLDRFLILGSTAGTYYVTANKLTKDNAAAINKCLDADFVRTIDTIVDVSYNGRAASNDNALFALAVAASHTSETVRKYALTRLPKVARTGTHLYHFAEFVNSMRGWGRGLRSAVSSWYTNKSPDEVARQITKYQQRDGWSARDMLRLSHPKTTDKAMASVFAYVTHDTVDEYIPHLITGVELVKKAITVSEVVKLINEYRLDREMIPTKWLNETSVWDAMLQRGMGLEAMIRNLPKMTSLGMMNDRATRNRVIHAISNQEKLRRSRIHPMKLLVAQKTYAQGHGMKGSLTWSVNSDVRDALNEAFYLSFGNVPATGKEMLLALDVSGSMSAPIGGYYSGTSHIPLSCAEGAAVMALVTKNVEHNATIMAFSSSFVELDISPKMTLEDVMFKTSRMNFSSTDCSLPMVYAQNNNMPIEAFSVYTDSETYAGRSHPYTELVNHRRKFGIESRLAVVGMASNGFSLANPSDAGNLDVVGFDTNTPTILSEFFAGNI